MIDSLSMPVLDESVQPDNNCLHGAEIISFELDIAGRTECFHINVTAKQATLSDIVPLARRLSTKLTNLFLERLRGDGQFIPCRKGCSACCSYLIPLSVPEVFRLREELLAMPQDKGIRILKSCAVAAKKILDESTKNLTTNKLKENDATQLSKWYAGLKLACPLLSDGLCMLYEQRPLACREHIATGSNFFCQPDHKGEPNIVPMPISVLEALGQLTVELENLEIEAVMLPLAFAWAQDNLRRSRRTWPAVTMVEHFVEILEIMASENSAMPAADLIFGQNPK